MPELPDILLYLHALQSRIVGRRVTSVRLVSPFLLRTVDPPLSAIEGRLVTALHRLGKRIVLEAEDELFLIFHLMIAGRFRWKPPGSRIPGKGGLVALDFEAGTLILTEAGARLRCTSCGDATRWPNTIRAGSRSRTCRPFKMRCNVTTTR